MDLDQNLGQTIGMERWFGLNLDQDLDKNWFHCWKLPKLFLSHVFSVWLIQFTHQIQYFSQLSHDLVTFSNLLI